MVSRSPFEFDVAWCLPCANFAELLLFAIATVGGRLGAHFAGHVPKACADNGYCVVCDAHTMRARARGAESARAVAAPDPLPPTLAACVGAADCATAMGEADDLRAVLGALEERTPERVWEMVSKGRLSVGFARPVRSHDELGPQSTPLLEERLCLAVPADHAFAGRTSVRWRELAGLPLILLARREGAGSHDAVLTACAEAGVTPEIVRTPSLMGTIFKYVEAGAGIGVVPECGCGEKSTAILIPLAPRRVISLVLLWSKDAVNPAADAFRLMVIDWHRKGCLRRQK
jgi:DNA-binding transcriptional LysR family regulator